MANRIEVGQLKIDEGLYCLIRDEIAPGTGVEADAFWTSLGEIVADLAPKNRVLLDKRDALQQRIDEWYLSTKGEPVEPNEYEEFLAEIGYLLPEGRDFQASTASVDPEIAEISGPQLVVPLDNARYALNAANARWGSLYDALYGTYLITEEGREQKDADYNPMRGAAVIAQVEVFLDEMVGLERGNFREVTQFSLKDVGGTNQLVVRLKDGSEAGLADPSKFVGFHEKDGELCTILFRNNGLHIEIQIDHTHPVGKAHPAGVKDVILESAITTIQDCEDSVAAVDAEDKTKVYSNWNGIMQGSLESIFEKDGQQMTRRLNADKTFRAPDGSTLTLPGRSLLLIRNVGIHMYTDAVTTADDQEIPEGFLDAMVTSLAAIHDLKRNGKYVNSQTGSILHRQTQTPRSRRSCSNSRTV